MTIEYYSQPAIDLRPPLVIEQKGVAVAKQGALGKGPHFGLRLDGLDQRLIGEAELAGAELAGQLGGKGSIEIEGLSIRRQGHPRIRDKERDHGDAGFAQPGAVN